MLNVSAICHAIPPGTSGAIVRLRLAAALKSTADVAQRALDIMTGEVAPDTGLLAAASGQASSQFDGIDTGLAPGIATVHSSVQAAELALHVRLVGCCLNTAHVVSDGQIEFFLSLSVCRRRSSF